jgi:hypothetical protein
VRPTVLQVSLAMPRVLSGLNIGSRTKQNTKTARPRGM